MGCNPLQLDVLLNELGLQAHTRCHGTAVNVNLFWFRHSGMSVKLARAPGGKILLALGFYAGVVPAGEDK